jgi:hypothetical protein
VVVDLEKKEELHCHWTQGSSWPDAIWRVRSFLNSGLKLAESAVLRSDAGAGLAGMSDHKLEGGSVARTGTQWQHQVRADVR